MEGLQAWQAQSAIGATTLACGVLLGRYFNFRLKSQTQTDTQWIVMVTDLRDQLADSRARITNLESKVDQLNRDHGDCLQKQAAFAAKIEVLERLQERGPNRHAPGTT